MTNRLVIAIRRAVEDVLPWFDRADHDRRDARTEHIRQRSIATRKRAELVIDEYRLASKAAGRAGERLIEETRRGGQ